MNVRCENGACFFFPAIFLLHFPQKSDTLVLLNKKGREALWIVWTSCWPLRDGGPGGR